VAYESSLLKVAETLEHLTEARTIQCRNARELQADTRPSNNVPDDAFGSNGSFWNEKLHEYRGVDPSHFAG
jgi:hypothetical protein